MANERRGGSEYSRDSGGEADGSIQVAGRGPAEKGAKGFRKLIEKKTIAGGPEAAVLPNSLDPYSHTLAGESCSEGQPE